MKSGRGVLLAAVWLMALGAHAGEFRRIGEFTGTSRDANCFLEDCDGDGELELIQTDRVNQSTLSHASHNLRLAQIFAPLNGQWVLRSAFIYRFPSNLLDGDKTDSAPDTDQLLPWDDSRPEGDTVRELSGDFSSDGVPDLLVAEKTVPASKDSPRESFVLRLKQEGKILYEDPLFEIETSARNFEKLQSVDFDKDGAMEVLAWLSDGGWGSPYAFIYGTPNSQWQVPDPFREPMELDEALTYLKGVRAASAEAPAPVSAVVSTVSATKRPPDDIGSEITTYRFRVEFSAVEGSGITELAPWRDYFMKWGIGYVQEVGYSSVEQVREMRMSPSGNNALEFETEYPRDTGWIVAGEYELWMECPYSNRAPSPFGWSGTLETPRIDVTIDNAWPKVESK